MTAFTGLSITRLLAAAAGGLVTFGSMTVTKPQHFLASAHASSEGVPMTETADTAPRDTLTGDTLVSLSTGAENSCIITARGRTWCWGKLGSGPTNSVFELVDPDARPVAFKSLSFARTFSSWMNCGLAVTNTMWCSTPLVSGLPELQSRKSQPMGKSPCPSTEHCPEMLPVPLKLTPPYRQLVTGRGHACLLTTSGAAFCWGNNEAGQLGKAVSRGTRATDSLEEVAGEYRFSQLAAGDAFTCGVTVPDRAVFCWGSREYGQTGDTLFAGRAQVDPMRITPFYLPGERYIYEPVQFVQVTAGPQYACALTTSGRVYCWGENQRCVLGRCGIQRSGRAFDVPMPGRAVEVHAGRLSVCARTADGRIFCWGDNSLGQLGSLVTMNAEANGLPPQYTKKKLSEKWVAYTRDVCMGGRCSAAPVEVGAGRRWDALSVGRDHGCALARDDGGIYCWGGSFAMVLGGNATLMACGDGSEIPSGNARCQPTPTRVPGLPRFAVRDGVHGNTSAPMDMREAQTEIVASKNIVRITFPRDTSQLIGWTRRALPHVHGYQWYVEFYGAQQPAKIELLVLSQPGTTRDFSSLQEVVAAGTPKICFGADPTTRSCTTQGINASVAGGRVTLTVTDRKLIQQIFELRPTSALAYPFEAGRELAPTASDSVRIRYVNPDFPLVSAKRKKALQLKRRAYEASISEYERRIVQVPYTGTDTGTIWIPVGDSLSLAIREYLHRPGRVFGNTVTSDSTWTIENSAIVTVWSKRSFNSARPQTSEALLTARDTGQTIIRLAGLHGPSDTMPSRVPVAKIAARKVIVTRPVRRIQIEPRIKRITVGESISLRVNVHDDWGRIIPGVPTRLWVSAEPWPQMYDMVGTRLVQFDSVGLRTVIAQFAGRADTMFVRVEPERRK